MHPLIPFEVSLHPIEVEARVSSSPERVRVEFELPRGSELLQIPAPAASPSRRDRLWERTCFEAFLLPEGGDAYWEINASPSGDWNVYRFGSYRQGMSPEERVKGVHVETATDPSRGFKVAVELERSLIPELARGLRIGITAVLELKSGEIEYRALNHVGEKPDFHLSGSFTLRIP